MSAIALGYGSMYNHANPANMRYASAFEGRAIRFTAARTIKGGEELTINYNRTRGEPTSDEDVWFTTCGVVLAGSDQTEDCFQRPKNGDLS